MSVISLLIDGVERVSACVFERSSFSCSFGAAPGASEVAPRVGWESSNRGELGATHQIVASGMADSDAGVGSLERSFLLASAPNDNALWPREHVSYSPNGSLSPNGSVERKFCCDTGDLGSYLQELAQLAIHTRLDEHAWFDAEFDRQLSPRMGTPSRHNPCSSLSRSIPSMSSLSSFAGAIVQESAFADTVEVSCHPL